jgi:hypothetical protein
MSTPDTTHHVPPGRMPLVAGVLAVLAVLVAGAALALDRWGPGNMGRGFAVGALVGATLGGVAIWRAWRRPDRATSGDRLFAGTADERDRAVAGRAFALLGAWALPLTFVATIAIALGAPADASMFFLIVGQVVVGAVAFLRAARTS